MLTQKFIPEYLHVLLILLKRHYVLPGVLQHLWNTGLLSHPVAVEGLFGKPPFVRESAGHGSISEERFVTTVAI